MDRTPNRASGPGFGRAGCGGAAGALKHSPKGKDRALERAEKHFAPVAKRESSANGEKDLIDHASAEIDQPQPVLAAPRQEQRA